MVWPDSRKVSRAPRYSGYHYVIITSRLQGYHLLRPCFPTMFYLITIVNIVVLQPQNCRNNFGLGFSHFARRY